MDKVVKFFRNLVDHPKTSAAGVALIFVGAAQLISDPKTLSTGAPVAAILTGVGLLWSADSSKVRK